MYWVFGKCLFGVNYFFALTTIISPDQRQLPFSPLAARSAGRRAEGEARPRPVFFVLREREFGAVGKWETWFWFSTFPSALVVGVVEMWESRRLLARFPRGSWKEGEACFWLSTLSTALAFPQLTCFPVLCRRITPVLLPHAWLGFPPVVSVWRAPPGSSGCSAR